MNEPAIGIIGGSGLYQMEGFAELGRTQNRNALRRALRFDRRRNNVSVAAFIFCRDTDAGTGFCRTN